MPQSFTCLHYHFIFSTKDRMPSITPEIQARLYEVIGGIIRDEKGKLIAAGGVADHVHLLAAIHKEQSISAAMRVIKSNSSAWVHNTFPDKKKFAWQAGYGAFAVSYSNLQDVEHYIANQAEHHKKISFQHEFVAFLKRHEIEYDEKYIWQ